jgi:23S rRNA (adenine2030-N6)-methyltransferase
MPATGQVYILAAMNYRHGFHAGNHADVLKHVVLLALVEALKRKESPFLVLDTHAGRGQYLLQGEQADATGEAKGGIFRLFVLHGLPALLQRYLRMVQADNPVGALVTYPGSPLLVAQAMRPQDRLVACELHHDEARALAALFRGDERVRVHDGDGYAAMKANLPPKAHAPGVNRGLVLIDPPYEAQGAEFDAIHAALKDALVRWPTGMFAIWYPIKQRKLVVPFLRRAAKLPFKDALVAELHVRPDDSPLRLNGSGLLIVNPPYRLDTELMPVLSMLVRLLGEAGASHRLEWIKRAGDDAPAPAPARTATGTTGARHAPTRATTAPRPKPGAATARQAPARPKPTLRPTSPKPKQR